MMRAYRCLPVALGVLLYPAAAYAACEASFVEGSNIVSLTPAPTLETQQLVERFTVRVRNSGTEECALRIGVGQELASTALPFPHYSLTGPSGHESAAAVTGAADVAGTGTELIIPGNGQVAVPYEVRMAVGWGSEAGHYAENLIFQLFDAQSSVLIESQRTQLSLDIPKAARIRFAGASGVDGPARIEMGRISPTSPTRSPPFALRILSTAAYRIALVSENQGALKRTGGPDLIPYQLSIGSQPINLSAGGDSVQVGRHTSSVGDVHPVTVVIDPDPRYHAGEYSDRITVTVTTI